jgi:prepilin-type N-terminal cleavage/methylation domain-containing protein
MYKIYHKKSFTLIEIMIVLAIIGLISAIAIPGLMRISLQKNIAKAKAELRVLQVAVESYYLYHNSTYPTALSDLPTAVPTIVRTIANDPFSNPQATYKYDSSPSKKYYVIYSIGSSGDGSASVSDAGVLTENSGLSCIHVSNIQEDATP